MTSVYTLRYTYIHKCLHENVEILLYLNYVYIYIYIDHTYVSIAYYSSCICV